MRKTHVLLLGAVLAVAVFAQPASAGAGSPVTIQGTLNFLQPEDEALTVLDDPAGALCPMGVGHTAPLPADASRGPHPRGQSEHFVGTAIQVVTCQGEGWDDSDTYTLRVTVKGIPPDRAEGTWSIVAATGRLAGLHGGGDYSALIDPFPIVTDTYTGSVHITP